VDDGPHWVYTDEEWRKSVGGRPLQHLDLGHLLLLHRHWIWANRECELFDAELRAGRPPRANAMAEDAVSAMFMWYALLWVVIEAANDRHVGVHGLFANDIADISDDLRRCRNAVFHVSRDAYYDDRLFDFAGDPNAAPKIRRISSGFGRLLLEELDEREIY
jgi:hypothetical protein